MEIEFMRPSRRTGESYGDQSVCNAYRYGQAHQQLHRTPTDTWLQIARLGFDSKTPLIEEKDIYGKKEHQ